MKPAPAVAALLSAYRAGSTSPTQVIAAVYDSIESQPLQPVWINIVGREAAMERARQLEADGHNLALPLFGVPFAIKDNIDLAGLPTTAACPEFAYTPERSAFVVEQLVAAGAIPIGKTNLDQFATGLVGVRSPYGACSSVFDDRYISGGSSSGSAVAVAKGLVSFALGTDTAGSGRVPAAFNGLVGLKPSRGLLSTSGVVPACRSLDCVSIFAGDVESARLVWNAARGFDSADPFARVPDIGDDAAPWVGGNSFRFGCPPDEQLEFFGDSQSAELFQHSVEKLQEIGGERVEIDLTAFRETAKLLYSGPWVAERFAAVERLVRERPEALNPVVRSIIAAGETYSAVDVFRAFYRLQELRRLTEAEWDGMDVLLLPTAPTIYTHAEVAAEPVLLNSKLGYYTNFVNLLDLAAVAIPAG
ncbi:MAG TPA: allophanate hydrolase, partial [Bryobacteraceae bacterium]|nr:allophanate hydrolase [Bryobacteraceae bacterium]